MSGDHPDIPFVQASGYTSGRPDGPPIWIVIHDMEYPERLDAAEWTANYFATGAGGRSVSSHYTADSTSIVQCVRLRDTAWTVGNRPGNYRGINWELAGYASQTREQWLDAYGQAMLARTAVIMRRDMATFDIPARLLTDSQVLALTPGVTSHAQLGRVFGGTDHTDPGKGFPWDHLVKLLGGDMTATEIWQTDGLIPAPTTRENQANEFWTAANVLHDTDDAARAAARAADLATALAQESAVRLDAIEAKLDQLLAQGSTGGVTATQIEDLLNRTVSSFSIAGSSALAVRPTGPGSGS